MKAHSPADQSYLTLEETSQRLSVSTTELTAMAERGELPALRLGEDILIPAVAVSACRLALSSRALLLVCSGDDEQRPHRQTLAQRRRRFTQRVGRSVEEYLCAFEDGILDVLDRRVAVHVIEAEELVAAERRR